MSTPPKNVVIMGAGPAGLTAAWMLSKRGVKSTLLERDDIVGGLARTVVYKGYRFDIGGHRFFTKLDEVNAIWKDVLGDEFLTRSRLSRIRYRGKYLNYPLKATNIMGSLGMWFCIRAGISYLKALAFPIKPEKSFEDWVTNRFGKMLYEAFFKSYTEKVWGIPCTELSAAWAAQRIRGLSFFTALKNAFFGGSDGGNIKTLIEEFQYPRLGPGQMWETMAAKLQQQGNELLLNQNIDKIEWNQSGVTAIHSGANIYKGDSYVSTISMRDLVRALSPAAPENVRHSAERLGYRDFVIIALVVDKPDINPDNWIYIHDDSVHVGRIQNFKNWSPWMVPDDSTTCLGMEHFCNENDAFWNTPDDVLIAEAKRELTKLGLAGHAEIKDGSVVRVKQAYPVYDSEYETHVKVVRDFLTALPNLHLAGRNGMHKYNNQDHAMLSAMLVADNIMGASHNVWGVNTAEEYHEEHQEKKAR